MQLCGERRNSEGRGRRENKTSTPKRHHESAATTRPPAVWCPLTHKKTRLRTRKSILPLSTQTVILHYAFLSTRLLQRRTAPEEANSARRPKQQSNMPAYKKNTSHHPKFDRTCKHDPSFPHLGDVVERFASVVSDPALRVVQAVQHRRQQGVKVQLRGLGKTTVGSGVV